MRGCLIVLLLASLLGGCAREPEWHEFKSQDGSFTVQVPEGKQDEENQTQRVPGGTMTVKGYTFSTRTESYAAGYLDYPQELKWRAGLDKLFDAALDGGVKAIKGTRGKTENFSSEGYPGRKVRFILEHGGGECRVLQVKARMYVLAAGAADEERSKEHMTKFFDSFSYKDPDPLGAPRH